MKSPGNICENVKRQKEHYDTKCLLNTFKAGDLVWYSSGAIDFHVTEDMYGSSSCAENVNDLNYLIYK